MTFDPVAFEAEVDAAVQPVLDKWQVDLSEVDAIPHQPDAVKFTLKANPSTPTV